MAHFYKPAGSNADGYLVDNAICPGSVSRLTVPVGANRDIGVFGADKLLVNVVPAGGAIADANIVNRPGNDFVLSVVGKSAGTTAIEARLPDPNNDGNWEKSTFWVRLNVDVVRAKSSAKFRDLRFQQLWSNHPSVGTPADHYPCKKPGHNGAQVPGVANQCAVRFSFAFQRSGAEFPGYNGLTCKVRGHRGHFIDPYSLARWLAQPSQLGAPRKFLKSTAAGATDLPFGRSTREAIQGKHGIVVFWFFFAPLDDGNMWGGHIDLWNGYKQAGGIDSYFDRSKQVWFWELVK
jgi:hypothetical protein